MVARPKSPDGRSVTRAVKLSEAESSAADAVRGDVRWSEWLRALVLAAIVPGQLRPAVPSPRAESVNLNEPVNLNGDAMPVNQNVAVNQNEAPDAPARKNCKHSRVRGKGVCPDCYEYVAAKR